MGKWGSSNTSINRLLGERFWSYQKGKKEGYFESEILQKKHEGVLPKDWEEIALLSFPGLHRKICQNPLKPWGKYYYLILYSYRVWKSGAIGKNGGRIGVKMIELSLKN